MNREKSTTQANIKSTTIAISCINLSAIFSYKMFYFLTFLGYMLGCLSWLLALRLSNKWIIVKRKKVNRPFKSLVWSQLWRFLFLFIAFLSLYNTLVDILIQDRQLLIQFFFGEASMLMIPILVPIVEMIRAVVRMITS
ncbi:MAG: hypothetical protein AAF770_03345 [Bacteroidota bacterium]